MCPYCVPLSKLAIQRVQQLADGHKCRIPRGLPLKNTVTPRPKVSHSVRKTAVLIVDNCI